MYEATRVILPNQCIKKHTEKMQRKLILPKIKNHMLVGYKPKKQSISKKKVPTKGLDRAKATSKPLN
jgi:hypothetical protein